MKKALALLIAAALVLGLAPLCGLSAADDPAVKDRIPIHEINIMGFRAPVVGSTPEFSYTLYVDESQGYFIVYQYWHDNTLGNDMFNEQTPFLASHMYSIGCLVGADDDHFIAEDCVFMFNGSPELVDHELTKPHPYFDGDWFIHSTAIACAQQGGVMGDVDGSGSVGSPDALIALRAALGLAELTADQLALADVDGSGVCDTADALLILRFALGMITGFPVN